VHVSARCLDLPSCLKTTTMMMMNVFTIIIGTVDSPREPQPSCPGRYRPRGEELMVGQPYRRDHLIVQASVGVGVGALIRLAC
jgi:hypothetical protein